MIWFRFNIRNPWHRSKDALQKDYVCKEWVVAKNKSIEIQATRWGSTDNLFEIEIDTCWFGEDHAGPEFSIQLGPYWFHIKLYDHRHWNHNEGRFMTDAEAKSEYEEWQQMAEGNHQTYKDLRNV